MRKIKIESHGISPWHYHLENMSWGFCRGKAESDNIMEYLNVDPKLSTDDSRGIEDILMADFLNTLSFMSADFLNNILKKTSSADNSVRPQVEENFEVRGNAGNYYIPYEDEKNGIRLAQPDGWISDGKSLFLLEAKGYRNSAALNKGQLAKDYLIAKSVAEETGHNNFYVLLIAENFENIYKSGKEYSLKQNLQKEFAELWQANVNDLDAAFGEKLSSNMGKEWDKFKKSASENIQKHFLWITWGEIKGLAYPMQDYDPKAKQIVTAIDFHSGVPKVMPIFSQLLFALAARQEPLYHFYNGGCGNATVKDYEKIYLEAIGETDSEQAKRWADWHKLAAAQEKVFKELSALEEVRRKAAAELKDAEKKIKEFYADNLKTICPRATTRKAFEMLGESSQLENVSEFFEQRYYLTKDEIK